jgi:hypothetical protein
VGRPNKIGIDYFPFDVDFFNDEKIEAISGEFGTKGEIVAIRLLCAIYRQGYFIVWNDQLRMKLLRQLPGAGCNLLDSIVARLTQWGFFDKTLFEAEGVLTSTGIQSRYFSITKRREKDSEYPFLLVSVCNNEVSAYKNPSTSIVSACKNPQSKVKNNNPQDNSNELSPPPGGKSSKKAEKPERKKPVYTTLNGKARELFEEVYLQKFDSAYYWSKKDAGNMDLLVKKIIFQRTSKGKTTEDGEVLYALRYMLENIEDKFIIENFNVSTINSKCNEIIASIQKNKTQKSHVYG